jgi:hypothetical protein
VLAGIALSALPERRQPIPVPAAVRRASASRPLAGAHAMARTPTRRHAYRVPVVREIRPGPPPAAGSSEPW